MLKTGVLGWWDGSAAKALTTNPEDSHDGSRNTTSTNYPQNSPCLPVLDFLCCDKALTEVAWGEKGLSYLRACSASHKARAGIWGRNWCRCFGGLLFIVCLFFFHVLFSLLWYLEPPTVSPHHSSIEKITTARQRWCSLLISILGRQRQADLQSYRKTQSWQTKPRKKEGRKERKGKKMYHKLAHSWGSFFQNDPRCVDLT